MQQTVTIYFQVIYMYTYLYLCVFMVLLLNWQLHTWFLIQLLYTNIKNIITPSSAARYLQCTFRYGVLNTSHKYISIGFSTDIFQVQSICFELLRLQVPPSPRYSIWAKYQHWYSILYMTSSRHQSDSVQHNECLQSFSR